jgi:hypothetical protein
MGAVEEARAAVLAGSLAALFSFLLSFLISGGEAATAPEGNPAAEATSLPE